MQKNNIVLIGFMASGKTAVAGILSNQLKMPFTDTDMLIENQQHMKISEIFRKKGEQFFRKKETEILGKLLFVNNFIISTGGGITQKKENRVILKKLGKVFFLKTDVEDILQRLKKEKKYKRPLINNSKDIKKTIETLLKKRQKSYKSCAKFVIDTSGLDKLNVAGKIIKKIGKK